MAVSAELSSLTPCARCQTRNASAAQFCQGCGESLWETCTGCNKNVRIGQTFCHTCGANLGKALETRKAKLLELLQDARRLGDAKKYDEAYALSRRVASETDYRLSEIIAEAKKLAKEFDETRNALEVNLKENLPLLEAAIKEKRFPDAERLYRSFPTEFLPEETKASFDALKRYVEEKQQLENDLAKQIQEKKLQPAAAVVERLLQLEPDQEKWQKLATKIASELLRAAHSQAEKKQYSIAKKILDSVPSQAREDQYRAVLNKVDDVLWMRQTVAKEPLLMPYLKPIAQKLTSVLASDDEVVGYCQGLLKEDSSHKPATQWSPVAALKKLNVGWMNQCTMDLWCRHKKINISSAAAISKQPTRFHQAIGLALMTWNVPLPIRFTEANKSSGLTKLWRKKNEPEIGWGIDIGDTGVRVIGLERSGDTGLFLVKHAASVQFSLPLHRTEMSEKGAQELRKGLTKIVEHFKLQQTPVHVNLAAQHTLGRFVDLPPIVDKKLVPLIDKEVSMQIPFLNRDEISSAHWFAEMPTESSSLTSRPMVLTACKKSAVTDLEALLTEVGLSQVSIVPAPVALLNLIRLEFADLINNDAAANDSEKANEASDATTKPAKKGVAFWILDPKLQRSSELLPIIVSSALRIRVEANSQRHSRVAWLRPLFKSSR